VPKTRLDKVKDLAKEATDAARLSLKEVAEKAAEVLDPGTASVPAKTKTKSSPKKPAPEAKTSATKSKTGASVKKTPTKAAAKSSTRAVKPGK